MKRNAFISAAICTLLIIMSLVLTSCVQPDELGTIGISSDDNNSNLSAPVVTQSIADRAAVTSDENGALLRENIFWGEGEMIRSGGDEMDWYYHVFGGYRYNSIPGYVVDVIGIEIFDDWRMQFTSESAEGWRDRREANYQTFIEDLNLSKEDIIRAMELNYGMPIIEIDALVTSARTGMVDIPTAAQDEEALDASFWMHQRSLSDIDALFSNDVYVVWAAYPGEGVFQNGKAYSPEWILNNMERSINEEQIPLEDIERIINQARSYPVLDEIRINAETVLQRR